MVFFYYRWVSVAGCCGYGDETSGSIRGQFLNHVMNSIRRRSQKALGCSKPSQLWIFKGVLHLQTSSICHICDISMWRICH
jgi:uncharacterized protein YcbK (DUF882 family)